jgi:uncharacterized tellurite resistance protein B-like protein
MIDHKKVGKDWKRNHFLLYLYLCAIEADDVMQESEIDHLLDQYESMNIDDENYVKTFNDVLIEYKAHDDREKIEFIHQYIPENFADPKNAELLLNSLKDISLSDGNVNPEESDIIKLVERLVGG